MSSTFHFDDELAEQYADSEKLPYLYRREDTGELIEVHMAYGEKLEREGPGGFIEISKNLHAKRALADEFERDGLAVRSKSGTRTRARWPMVSVAAGVNPSQRKELEAIWQQHGVTGCRMLPNGDIEYESRGARRADHEARGLFDRSGGYGDAMPKNL
jgi:hypothetical protein